MKIHGLISLTYKEIAIKYLINQDLFPMERILLFGNPLAKSCLLHKIYGANDKLRHKTIMSCLASKPRVIEHLTNQDTLWKCQDFLMEHNLLFWSSWSKSCL